MYVSDKQISALVPYGLAGNPTTHIQVVYLGAAPATIDALEYAAARSRIDGTWICRIDGQRAEVETGQARMAAVQLAPPSVLLKTPAVKAPAQPPAANTLG
jgi:hypothetical protein